MKKLITAIAAVGIAFLMLAGTASAYDITYSGPVDKGVTTLNVPRTISYVHGLLKCTATVQIGTYAGVAYTKVKPGDGCWDIGVYEFVQNTAAPYATYNTNSCDSAFDWPVTGCGPLNDGSGYYQVIPIDAYGNPLQTNIIYGYAMLCVSNGNKQYCQYQQFDAP